MHFEDDIQVLDGTEYPKTLKAEYQILLNEDSVLTIFYVENIIIEL